MSVVVEIFRRADMRLSHKSWCVAVLLILAGVLLTCSEKHVAKKPTVTTDKIPAKLKIETSNKGATIVTLKVSILDDDDKLITGGIYASSALKFKHRCGSADMVIDEQNAIKGVARILFHRAAEDCTVSVEYSNLGESLVVAKLERDDDDTPIADPITLKIIDADGDAVTDTSKFTRIGIRSVGVHLIYADEENKSQLGQIPATVRLMCDYDRDATTYEKQLCIGRMKPNVFGVAAGILQGDNSDTWDSNGDRHDDGNEACYANVFTEACQLEAQVDIIVGGKGKIKQTQKFLFHQLGLKLTSLRTSTQTQGSLPNPVKRGLAADYQDSDADSVLKFVRVSPTEDDAEFTERELDAFRPLLKTVLTDNSIETSRAPKHNLYVRIGVEKCSYTTNIIRSEVIYRSDTTAHANPRLPAADYDSEAIGLVKGKVYATFFDTSEGWFHLAWDRLVQYDTTAFVNKNGPGVMPIGATCNGKCLTGNVGSRASNTVCTCTTGVPACLIDLDGFDLNSDPKVYANCHTDNPSYVCRATQTHTCANGIDATIPNSLSYFDDIYKETKSCEVLVEMSRGEIEAPDALPVCSDDPANKDSCYSYDDLSTLQPAEDGKFCSQGMCEFDTVVTDKEAQRRIAQTCELKDAPAMPAAWTHGTASDDWLKCEELIAIRKRIDSWHKKPEWASNTITVSKVLNIDD